MARAAAETVGAVRGHEHLPALNRALDASRILTAAMPARASARQIVAFLAIAAGAASGASQTMTEIAGAEEALGPHAKRAYSLFLAPTKREPDGLGWVAVEPDEEDRRRKLLRLTEDGWAMVERLSAALEVA